MYKKLKNSPKIFFLSILLSSLSMAEGFIDNFQGTWGLGASVLDSNYKDAKTETTLAPYIFGSFYDLRIEANRLLYPLYQSPAYTLFAAGNYRSNQYSETYNKDRSIELGLTFDVPLGYGFNSRVSAFNDISNKHNGYELEAQIYRGNRIGNFSVLTALSVQYQDESLVDYYYGTNTYKADDTNVFEAELIVTYPIEDFAIFSGFRSYWYGSSVSDSPLSSSSNTVLGFAGIGYTF